MQRSFFIILIIENQIYRKTFTDPLFCSVNFNKSSISFTEAKFIEGDVSFLGTNFDKTKFIKSNVTFTLTKSTEVNISFERSRFKEGNISFQKSELGKGKVSFQKAKVEDVMFFLTNLLSISDFSFKECNKLSIMNCVIDGTLDLQSKINILQLKNVKNLGKIYHDWNEHNLKQATYNQEDEIIYLEKAKQFRLLKEKFSNIGQYDDEDCAYFEFKRCMRLSKKLGEGKEEEKFRWLRSPFRKLISFIQYIIFEKIGGYGTKPRNVFVTMLITVSIFALIYMFVPYLTFEQGISDASGNELITTIQSFTNAIYYSGITFLTVGYGDISPVSTAAKLLSVTEGFMGIFLMSYFTVAFVRKLLR